MEDALKEINRMSERQSRLIGMKTLQIEYFRLIRDKPYKEYLKLLNILDQAVLKAEVIITNEVLNPKNENS